MNYCSVFIFLALTSLQCYALQWIFDPRLARDMSIESHGEMLDSKLSLSGKSQKLTELESDTIESENINDHQTRSGGGRGLKFPNNNNVEESLPTKTNRFSRQFSLVPYSHLVKSRVEGPSGTFRKFTNIYQ